MRTGLVLASRPGSVLAGAQEWWLYEAAGVPEYLIVDPSEEKGKLLRLEEGRYMEIAHLEWGKVLALLGGRISITLS